MATTAFKGNPVTTSGELPAVGSAAPAFDLVGSDLAPVTSESLAGKRVVLNIFPSLDTGVCATTVRRFNQMAASLPGTMVLCISKDLPFAQNRFCAAEGIDHTILLSDFRYTSRFGKDYGVLITSGPMRGLLARAVVIIDPKGKVIYSELVSEMTREPNYEAALKAVK